MWAMLFPILAGVACILLGLSNMRGNISTIHEYHRKRVREEDKLPLGRQVGLGTVIIGAGIGLFGILSLISLWTEVQPILWVGMGCMGAGFVAGIFLSFRAMIKYNKGIF